MAQKSVYNIARNFDLFGEYVDPDATVSREQFDAMSIEEREALIAQTFPQDFIDSLNAEFGAMDYTTENLEAVASKHGLEEVYEDGACRIYEIGGVFINAWIDEDFGSDMGFDDQVEWYTDPENA